MRSSSEAIAQKSLYWLIHRHTIGLIATDGNYSYETMFPHHQKHIVTKAETCLVEAKNSSLRAMLARLNRRTTRYSKSIDMLRYSVWFPSFAKASEDKLDEKRLGAD